MRTLKTFEDVLNKDFLSLCQWFIDNKLPIHFGEDQNPLFSKEKSLRKINISFAGYFIKQHKTEEYLGDSVTLN